MNNEKRYEFFKEKHIHTLDGKPLTGVTTVLGVIAKPALIQWAANMAVEYILNNAIVGASTEADTVIVLKTTIEKAKTAHRIKKEKAGDWGTLVHAWVEKYAMSKILEQSEPVILEGKMGEACSHFKKWSEDNKVKFLESEKNVWSEKLWIGGIADLLVEIDGQKWVADIKTGSGIYPEHFAQMSAYQLCMEEMGMYEGVVGHIVLNLKKDGSFDERRSVSNEDSRQFFLSALSIYRSQEKLKNQVIQ